MGRTLDLPSVIELAPCKYKRVYFYFEWTATAVEERNISQLDIKLQERRLNMF
jgi:hypothetical protein